MLLRPLPNLATKVMGFDDSAGSLTHSGKCFHYNLFVTGAEMACIEANKKNIDNLRRQQQKHTEVPITAAAAGGLGTVQSESTDMAAAADRHDTAVEGVYPLICYRICF